MKLKLDGHQAILAAPHIYRKESDLQPKGSVTNPIVQNQKEMFKSNIFVTGIPSNITKEELEAEFGKAGTICSIKLKAQFQKDRDSGQSF
jgi:RNA recognition motif-containing protein